MVTVALILAAAVLTLTGVVASLASRLRAAGERADFYADLADTFLRRLVRAGDVEAIDTCQRTQGSAR